MLRHLLSFWGRVGFGWPNVRPCSMWGWQLCLMQFQPWRLIWRIRIVGQALKCSTALRSIKYYLSRLFYQINFNFYLLILCEFINHNPKNYLLSGGNNSFESCFLLSVLHKRLEKSQEKKIHCKNSKKQFIKGFKFNWCLTPFNS